eukprot:159426-Hanusia_phi.AAC.2
MKSSTIYGKANIIVSIIIIIIIINNNNQNENKALSSICTSICEQNIACMPVKYISTHRIEYVHRGYREEDEQGRRKGRMRSNGRKSSKNRSSSSSSSSS